MTSSQYRIRLAGSEVTFACAADDTLLRAGQRAGLGFPYECNVGSCGTCRFELVEGEVQVQWEEAPGLKENDRKRNRYLGCQTRPLGDCAWKKSVECWAASGGPADRQATGFVAVVLDAALITLLLLTVVASLAALIALRRTRIRSAFLVGTGAALAGWLVTGSIVGLAVLTLRS